MGNNKFTEAEIVTFCTVMCDFSVDNTVDVTDPMWRSTEENCDKIYDLLVEADANWDWVGKQLKVKWKNLLTDFGKVKKQNATTGETRRTMPVMAILEELIPSDFPLVTINAVDSVSTPKSSAADFAPKPKKKLDVVETAILNSLSPGIKSEKELEIEKQKNKVELFKSFTGRSSKEVKEMLDI
eukprot:NODE_780_length_3936_cov_0.468335.p1 type:complete len:184 gc:universal NODE_780_length_3936_cov_0.468335:554-3(-)